MKAEGTAMVTGAGRGLGRAVALALAEAGFDVVATMRRPADGVPLLERARAAGLRLRVAELDVTRPETIRPPDGLRVLVNNAGIEVPHESVEATTAEVWRRALETNLIGAVEVTRRCIAPMRAAGGGVVCLVTSSSLFAAMPFFAVYRATKAALSAFGESLRAEVDQFGIRVVEVMPGPVATDMLAHSEQPPAATAEPLYRALAERMVALRAAARLDATATGDAARAIVEAVLSDDGRLRHACDPVGASLLARHGDGDETVMRGLLAALADPG